jgi:hypothetical protein
MDFSRTVAATAQGRIGQTTCSRLAFGGRLCGEDWALASAVSGPGQSAIKTILGLAMAQTAPRPRNEGPSWW